MSFDPQVFIAFISAAAGAISAWFAANVSNRNTAHNEMARFREDLFKLNDELREEIGNLRARIRALEEDGYAKGSTILKLETRIARIKSVIFHKFNEDIDDLVAAHEEATKKG